MEIENHVQETIRAFGGIKSSLPHGALNSTDAEDCVNFVPRRTRLRKLWGTVLRFTSGAGNGPIGWIGRLQDRWLAQHGNAVIKELNSGQYDFEQVGEIALGESNRARSAKWENRVFLSNGVENKFIEHTPQRGFQYLTLGLDPPGGGITFFNPMDVFMVVAPTTVSANASSDLPDANFEYQMTFWDDVRKVESLPYASGVGEDGLWFWIDENAPPIGVPSGGTGKQISIDISAIKDMGYDERVTHFIIYRRTQADGAVWKRVPVITGSPTTITEIANDTFVDTVAEADLGTVLDLSISPPPSGRYYRVETDDPNGGNPQSFGPRFTIFFRDQLWLFGVRFPGTERGFDPEEYRIIDFYPQSGIAYASDVGNPDYWLYTFDIGKSTGQEDTGVEKHNNILMFFKSRSAYRLIGSSPENYEISEMDANKGFTIPGSVRATSIGVVGIGEGGFTLFTGIGEGALIGDELFDTFDRINMDYADQISSAYDSLEEKYECSVPLDGATHNTHVFSLDCKTRTWTLTRRAFGAGAYELVADKIPVSLLGDRQNGRLYSASDYSKVTLNGQTMHGKWRSRAIDFGLPGDLKSVQMVEITARAVTDFRLSIDLIMDFGQGDTASVEDVAPDVRGDKWAEDSDDTDGMNWDSGQWSKGSEKKKFTILIQGVAKNFNLVIRNSDRDADKASFEIEEVIVHASRLSGNKDAST